MDINKSFNEVAGRKNFGPAHALMTTPQPCVMIATWDKDHTPDVMMAAWAGQYDHNQIVVRLTQQTVSSTSADVKSYEPLIHKTESVRRIQRCKDMSHLMGG